MTVFIFTLEVRFDLKLDFRGQRILGKKLHIRQKNLRMYIYNSQRVRRAQSFQFYIRGQILTLQVKGEFLKSRKSKEKHSLKLSENWITF